MIVLVDNYDSFVYNLARYLQRLGQTTHVVRSDQTTADAIEAMAPEAVVLSPGPGTPQQAGCSIEVVRRLAGQTPILGVCLGHQAIAVALGGRVTRSPEPRHGRGSWIHHQGAGVLATIPNPFFAGRYHSLIVDDASLPADLLVTARTSEGLVMAIEHQEHPLVGWQFHPESILTDCGYELLSAFLRRAGCTLPAVCPGHDDEQLRERAAPPLPAGPVTF